jgi:hypothetical protein
MFKGVLVGVGIILGSILPPAFHFILFPPSPFFAGYFGINYARPEEGSYAVKGLMFGSILALVFPVLLLVGALPAILVAIFVFDVSPDAFLHMEARTRKLIIIIFVALTLYVGSMSTLGAMYSALKAQKVSEVESESESSPEGP